MEIQKRESTSKKMITTHRRANLGSIRREAPLCSIVLCTKCVTIALDKFTQKEVHTFSHWGKNPHFIQNSHIENPNFYKIHLSEISFFTKFTFLKSHFSQNSHFQSLIFKRELLSSRASKLFFFFRRQKPFSQNSHF